MNFIIVFVAVPNLKGKEYAGSDVRRLWKFNTEGPVRSAPVVTGRSIFVGSDSGSLFAVDTETGKEKWRFEADPSISSDPFLDGNNVYFSTKRGSLYSIGAEIPVLNWRFSSGAAILHEGGWDYFVSSPVVAGKMVVFGSGDGCIRGKPDGGKHDKRRHHSISPPHGIRLPGVNIRCPGNVFEIQA